MLTGGFGRGTALGFGCSGLFVAAGSWRLVFVAGAAMVLVVITVVLMLVPSSPPRGRVGLDLVGTVLLTFGLVLLLVALTESESRGWSSPLVLGAFVVALVLLAAWIAYDTHVAEPLLDLRLLAQRPILLANAATVALGFVMFGVYFLVPYLLTNPDNSLHTGAIAAGLYLLPLAGGQLLCGLFADRVARLITPQWTYATGLALATAGAAGFALLHTTIVPVLIWGLLIGGGAGLGIAVASTIISRASPSTHTGVSTAMNSVLRRMGGGIGGQICAALLASSATPGNMLDTEQRFVTAFPTCALIACLGAVLASGTSTHHS